MTDQPSCYGWRKYDVARPVYRCLDFKIDPAASEYYLWAVPDHGQHPELNRWDKLSPAFSGFISRGIGRPIACCYSAQAALEVIDNELLYRAWTGDGSDAAEVFDYFCHNFLGVWWGDRTPFFLSNSSDLFDILKT